MKIDQLIYFVETAKQEHIGRASKILGISPSAISHSIRSLEGELGYKLFQKNGKFINLTEDGRNLLGKSESLIAEFQSLKYNLLNEETDNAYYKLGATHTLSSKIVTPAWAELSQSFSKTKIDLLTLRSSDILNSVVNKELDLGVIFSPQDHPSIEKTVLHEGELVIIVRKDHPALKKKGKERLRELSNYPAILPKSFTGIDLCIQNPMFDKFDIKIDPDTLIDSYDIAMELVPRSNHWSFITDIVLDYYPDDYEIIKPRTGWDAKYNISLIWYKRRFVPQFFKDLKSTLESSF